MWVTNKRVRDGEQGREKKKQLEEGGKGRMKKYKDLQIL